MNIVFLTPYPFDCAPSQRFRFEQYIGILQKKGFTCSFYSFQSVQGWTNLYKEGKFLLNSLHLVLGFLRRIIQLTLVIKSDYVFIHREATPIGPPIFEWTIARVLQKKLIYDFDDAIWLTDRTHESKVMKFFRWRNKVKSICKWSHKVSCGNEYLAGYARKHNTKVVINPTTIDTEKLHNPEFFKETSSMKGDSKIFIGWTGSHTTLKYLHLIERVINKLLKKHPQLHFLVIADQKPELNVERMEYIPWKKETEAEDLLKIDIGIMPLPDNEWTRGKCGFKALQYMAMGIPCVVSPVGVNAEIVDHGKTGLVASTEEEWLTGLDNLILNPELRAAMGQAGRKKVIDHYSVVSNTANFLSLFA